MSTVHRDLIIAGYSPRLRGGVVNVTRVFTDHVPGAELHPILHCYAPASRALARYLWSLLGLLRKIFFSRRQCILLLIIGSPGDALRAVPIIWAGRLRGHPVCCQYHKSADHIVPRIRSAALRGCLIRSLGWADAHWFLSRRLERGFRPYLPARARTVVIPNAMEQDWLRVDPLPLTRRNRDVVFLGRWSWEKGVDDLTAVMARLEHEAHCHAYSSGVPNRDFPGCTLHHWVEQAEVREVLRSARLLVLPSYAEAYPTVLLEALACGTPFVASDVGGIADIAEESGGGKTFRAGDLDGFESAIREVLSDPERWQAMSRSGRTWIRSLVVSKIEVKWREFLGSLSC